MSHPFYRFAYRVALKLGWYDVDRMLESADPRQLEKWYYYFDQEPFGDEWDRTSLIATEITNNFIMLLSAFSEDRSKVQYLKPDHFVPGREPTKFEDREISVTSKEALMFFSQICGVK